MPDTAAFITGINYWPARSAMYWWKCFDAAEVEQDFKQLARFNFKVVRIFLTWEDFQPQPDKIPPAALDNLKRVADIASSNGLMLNPTFFCGHMSGINWIPSWMLESKAGHSRFPVYSNGSLGLYNIRNFYSNLDLMEAQIFQIEKVCTALQNHSAIWAYDLGNESSNCVIPPDRSAARNWLTAMTQHIKKYDHKLVTLGMHAEDLEQDRRLWPQDAALCCDFLCMHGYPFYLDWAANNDVYILPFLALVTSWLGGKPVLFQEFGVPTRPLIGPLEEGNAQLKYPLWSETEAAAYYKKALSLLAKVCIGAMGWCFADYHPVLWSEPPLDMNPHERYFGLFRPDDTAKPAVHAFDALNLIYSKPQHMPDELSHLFAGWDRNQFYANPRYNLGQLYQKYKRYVINGDCLDFA